MTTSTLHLTRGLPGAGKSTWARQWVAEDPRNRSRVNRDDLRQMLYGTTRGLTFDQESHVTSASHSLALAHLRRGLDVVADDTNLQQRYVGNWRQIAQRAGAGFEVHDFDVDIDVAIDRDAARDEPVGEDVIRRMSRFLVKGSVQPLADMPAPVAPKPYTPRPDAEDAVLVDIDGTLARMTGRSPYDFERVGEDEPIEAIVELVGILRAYAQVIFLSGRDESCRAQTEQWLDLHVDRDPDSNDEPLYMRPAGDKRRDSIVKAELFDQHIRDHYNVRYVLDDRKQVVRMWRDLGLTCLQVADGDF